MTALSEDELNQPYSHDFQVYRTELMRLHMETKGRIVVMSTWLIHPTWVPLVVFLPELHTHVQ